MALAALGMAASTAIGSLVGHSQIALCITSVLWAGLCGRLASQGIGAWWIGLQWAIGLFVGTAFPAPLAEAAIRAALMLGGGALQFAIVVGAWRWLRPRWPAPAYLWRAPGAPDWRGVLPAALAVLLAVLAAGYLDLGHRYWAPLTALIVIRPDLSETASRALYRGLGTLAGAGLATLADVLLQPALPAVALLCLLFAWLTYVLQRLHYAFFVACLTAFIVFLLEFSGLPEAEGARDRILAALVGIAVSLVVAAAVRTVQGKR